MNKLLKRKSMKPVVLFLILIFDISFIFSCTLIELNKKYLNSYLKENKPCGYLPISDVCYPPFARRENDVSLKNITDNLDEPLAVYDNDDIKIDIIDIDCSCDHAILLYIKNKSDNIYNIVPSHHSKRSLIEIYIASSQMNQESYNNDLNNFKLYSKSCYIENACVVISDYGGPIDVRTTSKKCYEKILPISIEEGNLMPNEEVKGVVWFVGELNCSIEYIYVKINIYDNASKKLLEIPLIEVPLSLELKHKWRERNIADYCYVYSNNPEECVKDFLDFLEE